MKHASPLFGPGIHLILEFGVLLISRTWELLQKWFLKFLFFEIFEYYPNDVQYEELQQAGFKMHSSKARRMTASSLFLYDVVRNRIVELEFLSNISLQVLGQAYISLPNHTFGHFGKQYNVKRVMDHYHVMNFV